MLQPSDAAPGLLIGADVSLPGDAEIGANVVIHDGTDLAAGVRIQDGAIVGKPLVLGPRSTAPADTGGRAVLETGATICAGAVVLAGARIGERAVVGDQAHVRERAVVGAGSVIGRGSAVDNDVTIGARVKIQTLCYITAFSTIEDDVFVAPGVSTTNDNFMGRHAKGEPLRGCTLRRACRVGGRATLLPGIEVGEESFVAAGSVVTRDVAARTVVMGVPARKVRDVGDDELLERWD